MPTVEDQRISKGVCHLELQRLRQSPDEVLASLGKTLSRVAWISVGPADCHWQLLDLIPKKSGGFRSVATMCALRRVLFGLLAPYLRAWDSQRAVPGDTALAGASSADRVFLLNFRQAVARALGRSFGLLLWDQASFYETITPAQLLRAHVDMHMPVLPLTMAVWAHGAPRLFRYKEALGRHPVVPGCSVVTGCTSSTSVARSVIAPAIIEANKQSNAEDVDDLVRCRPS